MEDYLKNWSMDSAIVLKPLQLVSADLVENDSSNIGVKVEQFSRGETAGKLLAELDKLKDETESYYNWNESENFYLPTFEDYITTNVDSTTSVLDDDLSFNIDDYQYTRNNNTISNNSDNFPVNVQLLQCQSERYGQSHAQPRQDFRRDELISASSLTPPHQFNSTVDYKEETEEKFYVDVPSPSIEKRSIRKNQSEVLLTPPDSPKEEEILRFLEEMNPDVLEEFLKSNVNNNDDHHDVVNSRSSDRSLSAGSVQEDFSSDYVSSPFVSSDSGMDEQVNSPVDSLPIITNTGTTSSVNDIDIKQHNDVERQAITFKQQQQQRRRCHVGGYKPYSRMGGGEEKKQRKKEQNKNAATRYRLKKKAEIELVLLEENQLEVRNKELREDLNEICREIKYLKSLMKDVYKAKGLIKK